MPETPAFHAHPRAHPAALGRGHSARPVYGLRFNHRRRRSRRLSSVGIGIDKDFFRLAETAIPKLAALYPTFDGACLEFDSSDYPQEAVAESQLTMALAESEMRYQVRKK